MATRSGSNINRIPTPHVHREGERCPWCDQPITHEKFQEIQRRIQKEERERRAEAEQRMRVQFERQRRADKEKADNALEALKKEQEVALQKAKAESERKAANARAAAVKEAKAQMASKLKAADREKAKLENALSSLKDKQESEFNRRLKGELAKAKEAHDKAMLAASQKKDGEAFRERRRLEKKVAELQRQLAKKTSNDIGEAAEIELYDELLEAFPDDDIKRVQPGEPGADILQKVMDGGQCCGRLIYDSKERQQWRHSFAAKLKRDQMAAEADHAIVATRVFPQGANQLHMQDGVFLAHPARVRMLATVLRDQVIRLSKLQLSNEERDRKVDELYEYINSERCHQLFERLDDLTEKVMALDEAEQKEHSKVWEKRGGLVRDIQKMIQGQLRGDIERIVGSVVN